MARVTVRPDLELALIDEGPRDAPALLLVTGLGGLKEAWIRQVSHFSKRYRVLAPDNRGLGGSSVIDAPTRMVDFADDLVRLLRALEVHRAHVFGVSMGGKIAMELALGWPDRVERLILGCTSAGEAHRVDRDRESALLGAERRTAAEWLEHVVPHLFGRAYREKNARSMEAFARSRERHPPDPRGIARQWEAYRDFDAWDRLPALTHPTLVLTGDEDTLTDPANSDRLAERIPNAVLHKVPGAGHSFHLEQPDVTNALIDAFLDGG